MNAGENEKLDRLLEKLDEIHRLINAKDAQISRLRAEVEHQKANHDDLVKRCALLRERPDLPVDRIPAYKELERLQMQLRLVPGNCCEICWTSAWAPVPAGTKEAVQLKNSDEWVICQQCQAWEIIKTLKKNLGKDRAAIIEYYEDGINKAADERKSLKAERDELEQTVKDFEFLTGGLRHDVRYAANRIAKFADQKRVLRELLDNLAEDITDGTFDKNNNRQEYLELIRATLQQDEEKESQ